MFCLSKNRFVELNLFFHFITEFRDPIFKNVHLPSSKNKNNFTFKRSKDYIYILHILHILLYLYLYSTYFKLKNSENFQLEKSLNFYKSTYTFSAKVENNSR